LSRTKTPALAGGGSFTREPIVIEKSSSNRKRICIVATVPFVLKWFMTPHIIELRNTFDITLVASGSHDDIADLLGNNVSFQPIQIDRRIHLRNDIIALIRLWRLFKRMKFDIVHSMMPKSGLLSMVAARFSGIPLRVHTFTGQVWANKKGYHKFILKSLDRILAWNATHLLADSPSQRSFLIQNDIVSASKIEVLANGSIAGVDTNRFKLDPTVRRHIRSQYSILDNDIVFIYLGRLNYDKGLLDLSRAFASIADKCTGLHLMIVGPDEEGLETAFSGLAIRFPGRVHRVNYTDRPEDYLSAADIFCLPSYREGFSSVIIEAASVGIPAIASRIYGVTDAVDDGVTGILHQPADDREIAKAMLLLATDDDLRHRMGTAAQSRARDLFSQSRITEACSKFYQRMIASPGVVCR